MALQELREKRAEAIADARSILDKAGTEKREMNGEEQTRFDAFMADSDTTKAEIDKLEGASKRAGRLADAEREMAESKGRRTAGDDPGNPRGDRGRDTSQDTRNDRGEREMRWQTRGGAERRLPLVGARATDAYRAAYEKFLIEGRAGGGAAELRALAADADADGGFLVAPMQMVGGLLKNVDDMVFVRQHATVMLVDKAQALGSPTLDADPADSNWTSEVLTGSEDSSMKFGKRELNPQPLAKRIKVSRKLLRMATMGAESIVRERLAYKFAITQEKAFLTGTGANQPLGLFTAHADGIPTSRDVSTGNTTTAITADGLIEAKYSIKSQYWARLRWLFHRTALKAIRKLKDGDGQYLWLPGIQAGQPDKLLDVPFDMSEYVPNTFTTGLYVGLIGDLSQYWIADSLNLEIQRLDELYAETNQVGFIGRTETDGMPVISEAFTRVKLA